LFSYSGTGESTCFHTQGLEKVLVFILRDERKYLFSYSGTRESICFHTQEPEKVLVFIPADRRNILFGSPESNGNNSKKLQEHLGFNMQIERSWRCRINERLYMILYLSARSARSYAIH